MHVKNDTWQEIDDYLEQCETAIANARAEIKDKESRKQEPGTCLEMIETAVECCESAISEIETLQQHVQDGLDGLTAARDSLQEAMEE